MTPAYKHLGINQLQARAEQAVSSLAECFLCPRQCRVNRLEGELGFCQTGRLASVASAHLHFGEEAPLVGRQGSGTIFFAGCNLGCLFCQNFDISHDPGNGQEVEPEQLAQVMLDLQAQGAININLVTPSHVVPQILEALVYALQLGLHLPIVYNSSGYDRVETLHLLEGIVDIHMPDTKFFHPDPARTYCQAEDYPQRAREVILEMHRQVGDLVLDQEGRAVRGLLVRHLLMPDDLAGTHDWLSFVANEVSRDTFINIMDQYRPCGQASSFPELGAPLPGGTRDTAIAQAQALGLNRLDSGPKMRLKDLLRFMD
ncbi:MAG: radical SAM protein [Desulfovermiculus sp.]|nr:radical SAM protein [Desulfovermiculus sp.]